MRIITNQTTDCFLISRIARIAWCTRPIATTAVELGFKNLAF